MGLLQVRGIHLHGHRRAVSADIGGADIGSADIGGADIGSSDIGGAAIGGAGLGLVLSDDNSQVVDRHSVVFRGAAVNVAQARAARDRSTNISDKPLKRTQIHQTSHQSENKYIKEAMFEKPSAAERTILLLGCNKK